MCYSQATMIIKLPQITRTQLHKNNLFVIKRCYCSVDFNRAMLAFSFLCISIHPGTSLYSSTQRDNIHLHHCSISTSVTEITMQHLMDNESKSIKHLDRFKNSSVQVARFWRRLYHCIVRSRGYLSMRNPSARLWSSPELCTQCHVNPCIIHFWAPIQRRQFKLARLHLSERKSHVKRYLFPWRVRRMMKTMMMA